MTCNKGFQLELNWGHYTLCLTVCSDRTLILDGAITYKVNTKTGVDANLPRAAQIDVKTHELKMFEQNICAFFWAL